MDKKQTERQKLAREGGIATLHKHGPSHYKKMAKKRWKNERARNKLVKK